MRTVKAGEIYQHFKGGRCRIINTATNTETNEQIVIYQALDGEGKIFARPYEMFVSEVDHDKYPDVEQQYRFEKAVLELDVEHEKDIRFFFIDTPAGKLKVWAKTNVDEDDDYPGVFVDLVCNERQNYGDLIACVEYDSAMERLQTVAYKIGNDMPAKIYDNTNGEAVE